MPPTPAAAPANPSPAAPLLRGVPGGYDLEPVPIHVEVRNGESAVSWLRRVSVRYDVPARDLLRTAGGKRPITATSRVAGRLRADRSIAQRLGLTAVETSRLVNPSPMVASTAAYTDTFRPNGSPTRAGSRYCPECLAGPGAYWPDHWYSPLSLICVVHGSYLARACPHCGQPPLASTAWLARPVELYRCPSRRTPTGTTHQQQGWCDHDLTKVDTTTAPTDQVEAQLLLHSWAPGPAEHATACGIAITHRIGFQALVELLDAVSGQDGGGLLDLDSDPRRVAAWLPVASRVLAQPTLDAAADTAAGLLAVDGAHAPITPAWRILSHRYNPLLAAVQLHSVRDQLPPAEQLMFRTGHPLPRYPAHTTPDNRRRLRLPAHHPHWPEPTPSWIPQTLWWNAVPTVLADHARSALVRSLLAMALAKTGSICHWSTIADDLHLPTTHGGRINQLIRYLHRNGTWPAVLTALERLMTGLEQHPPHIDYPNRRAAGDNLALLTAAVNTGRRRHPSAVPMETLVRQFWERLTGGDIAYAPTGIRIDLGTTAYRTYRHLPCVRESDLFHVAHQHLCRTSNVEGPLTWRPGLLPELPMTRVWPLVTRLPAMMPSSPVNNSSSTPKCERPVHELHLTDSAYGGDDDD
jgi:hypothetical protein